MSDRPCSLCHGNLRVPSRTVCKSCKGRGVHGYGGEMCQRCDGEGYEPKPCPVCCGNARVYLVTEKLIGEAEYEIVATSKAEALRKLRAGDHDGMLERNITHTGNAEIRRA